MKDGVAWIAFLGLVFFLACGEGNNDDFNGSPTPTPPLPTPTVPAAPVCGNDVTEVGEACDDGANYCVAGCGDPGDCCSNCSRPQAGFCGSCPNGTREGAEVCDDGENTCFGDGCTDPGDCCQDCRRPVGGSCLRGP